MNEPVTVSDWVWSNDALMNDVKLGRPDDPDTLQPDALSGQFALHTMTAPGEHHLARDMLGVNKLFYAIGPNGEVVSSNFVHELRARGFPLSVINSVPSGHGVYVDCGAQELQLTEHSRVDFSHEEPDTAQLGQSIRNALDGTFERLRQALGERQVFVTLSGGLDSTTIAALAQQWLPNVTAITFSIGDATPSPGSDLDAASKAADALQLPHTIVNIDPDSVLELLDTVLLYGQDWREFNVHCGLVNASLGQHLAQASSDERRVVLTGDLMNELMADYAPESYRGRTYYALPRMKPGRLRRTLVEGLDSGDREVGIFAAYGIDVLQPYAQCAALYARVPAASLDSDTAKRDLVEAVMGDAIPNHVYARPKVRAQMAESNGSGGTLSLLADRDMDADFLFNRYCELIDTPAEEVRQFIRGGYYRFRSTFPAEASLDSGRTA